MNPILYTSAGPDRWRPPLWVCDTCGRPRRAELTGSRHAAEQCCQCVEPGCTAQQDTLRLRCAAHAAAQTARALNERETKIVWVEADDWDGPVLLTHPDHGETYHPDLGEAIDALDGDLSGATINPCTASKPPLDLAGIAGRWIDDSYANLDDGDPPELSERTVDLLRAAETAVLSDMSEIWTADDRRRIRIRQA